ncbi:hypothetical protein ACSNOI_23265 [Actinomadura kijaniata]
MTEQEPDRRPASGTPHEDPDATREGEGAGDRPEELNPDDFE